MQNNPYFCPILMKLEFPEQILENIKLHENPSSRNRVLPGGQTDRHDDVNRSFP